MQPTTIGMAAIRAKVRILGRDNEPFASPLVVAMFMRLPIPPPPQGQPCDTYDLQLTFLTLPGVAYPGWVWKNSKILRALSALTPGTLPRSAIDARSISFRVPK